MTELEKIELAIRRAAAQMPNHQSRAFRLVADQIWDLNGARVDDIIALNEYRNKSYEGD